MPRDKNGRNAQKERRRQRSSSPKGGKSSSSTKNVAKATQEQVIGSRNSNKLTSAHAVPALFAKFVQGAASTAAAKATNGLMGWASGDSDQTVSGAPGSFDTYLLAVSWAPRFCCTNVKQCKAESMDGETDLSVHGLWPAYSAADARGRTYPQFCSPPGKDAAGLDGREAHEYKKHGTCTSLGLDRYFAEESRVAEGEEYDGLRDLLAEAASSKEPLSLGEVLAALGGERRAAIMTDKFCRLAEITTCYRKAKDGSVGERIDCPDHILGSNRNAAVLEGCQAVHLDPAGSCSFISKELLRHMKAASQST